MEQTALRGKIFFFKEAPHVLGDAAWNFFDDGLLWLEDGHVKAVGAYSDLRPKLADSIAVQHFPNHLITPGFVDCHVHYPQLEMMAAWGERLLDWLQTYTFPVEARYADLEYATQQAQWFIDELLRNGTTTAMVFATVHPQSVDALMQQAQSKSLRMISGKVLMDRNVPDELRETAQQGYDDSRELILRWHGVDRLSYAVTPRFAPTSSAEQLSAAGTLLSEFPDVYMQTHIAETTAEVEWVKTLFPNVTSYAEAYYQAGLLGSRSVLAHGIYLQPEERALLAETGAAIAHCPTSNLFLGSGLFPLHQAREQRLGIALGSDVGAGTSLSLLRTMNEAYKVQQLQGNALDPFDLWYLATLGGARALHCDDQVGSLQPGYEADFIVIDLEATSLLRRRLASCDSLSEMLFVLAMLGDDRIVAETWILGKCAWRRSSDG